MDIENSITVLESNDIPTLSYSGATAAVAEITSNQKRTERLLKLLTGTPSPFDVKELTGFYLSYLVQNIVKIHRGYASFPLSELLNESYESALVMHARVETGDMQFVKAVSEEQQATSDNPHPKGQKKERAIQIYQDMIDNGGRQAIMQCYMDELDMSKAGAMTYFYLARKHFA